MAGSSTSIGRTMVHLGDCVSVMGGIPDASMHAIVTDPPYGLGSIGVDWDRADRDFTLEWSSQAIRVAKPGAYMLVFGGTRTFHRQVCALEDAGWEIRDHIMWVYGSGQTRNSFIARGMSDEQADKWRGWGAGLKPAWDPITVARKPLDGSIADNLLLHETGAMHGDACRVPFEETGNSASNPLVRWRRGVKPPVFFHGGMPIGRWPTNVIHDGSDDVMRLFPPASNYPDVTAARFFFCAKAMAEARGTNNTHPTAKPVELMRYLCRLITAPGGTILDPFCGSGSTLVAATLEHFDSVGIEQNQGYYDITIGRLKDAQITLAEEDRLALRKARITRLHQMDMFGEPGAPGPVQRIDYD